MTLKGEIMKYDFNNIVNKYKAAQKKIVFVCGCFDILHCGHIELLNFAKSLGDILIVGLNSDSSVRALKGKNRPIYKQGQRLFMIEALKCVDNVVIFDETNACVLIEFIRPDIFVLGNEYKYKKISENHSAELCGCKIIYYDKNTDISTTQIIEKITNR